MPLYTKPLVTEAGGRGSALVHGYSRSLGVCEVAAAPGNGLMSLNVREGVVFRRVATDIKLKRENAAAMAATIIRHGADIVDACQDDIVAGGLVNHLHDADVAVVGPTAEAARLEWDKAWARDFMRRYLNTPQFSLREFPELS